MAALDLGGGSIQVSFNPKSAYKMPLLSEYIHTVSTPSGKIDVFTNSYLHLGLQAVRHAVYTHGYELSETNLESVCVNPIVKSNPFKYGTKVYSLRWAVLEETKHKINTIAKFWFVFAFILGIFSGQANPNSPRDNPVVDFDKCVKLIKKITMRLVVPKPITLNQNQISAFSYFFERAIETGLVGE